MTLLRRVLFAIRNRGRTPPYPFEDDFIDTPLELHVGPWGSTQWRDPTDGSLYEVNTVHGLSAIADSVDRDIAQTEPQVKEALRKHEHDKWQRRKTKSPLAIGFWRDSDIPEDHLDD